IRVDSGENVTCEGEPDLVDSPERQTRDCVEHLLRKRRIETDRARAEDTCRRRHDRGMRGQRAVRRLNSHPRALTPSDALYGCVELDVEAVAERGDEIPHTTGV